MEYFDNSQFWVIIVNENDENRKPFFRENQKTNTQTVDTSRKNTITAEVKNLCKKNSFFLLSRTAKKKAVNVDKFMKMAYYTSFILMLFAFMFSCSMLVI